MARQRPTISSMPSASGHDKWLCPRRAPRSSPMVATPLFAPRWVRLIRGKKFRIHRPRRSSANRLYRIEPVALFALHFPPSAIRNSRLIFCTHTTPARPFFCGVAMGLQTRFSAFSKLPHTIFEASRLSAFIVRRSAICSKLTCPASLSRLALFLLLSFDRFSHFPAVRFSPPPPLTAIDRVIPPL